MTYLPPNMERQGWSLNIPTTSRSGNEVIFRYAFSPEQIENVMSNGVVDSTSANETTLRILLVTWPTLLSDSPYGWRKRNSEVWRFITALLNDPWEVVRQYDELNNAFWSSIHASEIGTTLIRPLHDLFAHTPIFKEYEAWFIHHDPNLAAFISTFLTFCKKLVWDASELRTNALSKWFKSEEQLKNVVWDEQLLKELRWVLQALTHDWSPMKFVPRHGGGAVSQSVSRFNLSLTIISKNWFLDLPPKIRFAYSHRGIRTAESTLDPTIERMIHQSSVISSIDLCEHGDLIKEMLAEKRSTLLFVPKTYDALRAICKEAIAVQFAQQGVLYWMQQEIGRGLVSKFVKLTDQSFNRDAARDGSKNLKRDTIDLKSASDLVGWYGVKSSMPAKILFHLAATRSSIVHVPMVSEDVQVEKFAPMGSALCFPVQTLMYLGLTLRAYLHHDGGLEEFGTLDNKSRQQMIHRLFETTDLTKPAIYGDDIVCDSRITSSVVSSLNSMGFLINEEKSFTGNAGFRESCGGFYMRGDDVTPVRLKIKPYLSELTAESLPSLIDAVNRLHDGHLHNTASALKKIVLYTQIEGIEQVGATNAIQFVKPGTDTSLALWSLNPHNTHLPKRKWVEGSPAKTTAQLLQRAEVKTMRLVPEKKAKVPKNQDWYRYLQWWRGKTDAVESQLVPRLLTRADRISLRAGDKISCFVTLIEEADSQSPPTKSVGIGTCLEQGWTPVL